NGCIHSARPPLRPHATAQRVSRWNGRGQASRSAQVKLADPSRIASVYGAQGLSDSTRTYAGDSATSAAANQAAARPAASRASSHVAPISASDPSRAGSLAATRDTPKSAYAAAMAYGSQAAA